MVKYKYRTGLRIRVRLWPDFLSFKRKFDLSFHIFKRQDLFLGQTSADQPLFWPAMLLFFTDISLIFVQTIFVLFSCPLTSPYFDQPMLFFYRQLLVLSRQVLVLASHCPLTALILNSAAEWLKLSVYLMCLLERELSWW